MALFNNLPELPELAIVEEGEYDLRIIQVNEVESKKSGRTGLMLTCEVLGEEAAEEVSHGLWNPMSSDTDRTARMMVKMIKEFVEGVGLSMDDELEKDDFMDLEFSAYLKQEEYNGEMQNAIARIV